jgi:hypothetical protein
MNSYELEWDFREKPGPLFRIPLSPAAFAPRCRHRFRSAPTTIAFGRMGQLGLKPWRTANAGRPKSPFPVSMGDGRRRQGSRHSAIRKRHYSTHFVN